MKNPALGGAVQEQLHERGNSGAIIAPQPVCLTRKSIRFCCERWRGDPRDVALLAIHKARVASRPDLFGTAA